MHTVSARDDFINKNSDRHIQQKWPIWLVFGLFLLWALPYFIQTLFPNTDWDGAWQHLPLSKLFLERGVSWVTPGFMQYNFPGTVHLVYSLFIFLKAEAAVIPLNFIVAIGIVISVYYFTNYFFGKVAARWAAAITTAINIMWEVSLTPRIDSFLAFFCLLAVYAFLLWIQDDKKTGCLIISSMMLGMAMGTKYTASVFVFVLVLLGIVHTLLKCKLKSIKKIPLFLIILIVLSIPSGWWYARNWVKLGDPVYPFLSGRIFYDSQGNITKIYPALEKHLKIMPSRKDIETVFHETGLDPFLDGEDNSDPTPKLNILTYWRMGLFNFWDILKNPEKYARKPYHEINLFLILFFLLPFFDRRKISLYLYGIGCFVYLFFAVKTHLLRYALPVFPLFAIGASRVLSRIRPKFFIYSLVVLLTVFLIRFGVYETKKVIEMDPIPYWTGKEERIDWLIRVGYNYDKTTPPFIKFVNEQIDTGLMSKNDTIFMIGEGKGNLLNCNYLPDSSRNARPWLEELLRADNEYGKIIKSFKKRGIHYLAINYFYLYWCFKNSQYDKKFSIFGLYHLQQFLEAHTEIIYNNNGMVFAKIK